MRISSRQFSYQTIIQVLILISGLSALSWTVLWQLLSSLALGVSAWGAALTLAVTMGGMCIGSLAAGAFLKDTTCTKPLRLYGIFEIMIGLSGLILVPAFSFIESIDTHLFQVSPEYAQLVFIMAMACVVGVPTILMGATMPTFGLVSKKYNISISVLYGLNTLGAASGALIAAFILIPLFTVSGTIHIIASFNIILGLIAFFIDKEKTLLAQQPLEKTSHIVRPIKKHKEFLIVFVTGFATLALEVAWFRFLTAAFGSTTAAFAVMLSAVLLSLGLAARFCHFVKKRDVSIGIILAISGCAILFATPIIERFDMYFRGGNIILFFTFINWLTSTFYVTAIPVMLLGVALPWILDNQSSAKSLGQLYALNTFAAVLGALLAGWLFLPTIGPAKTAWLIGILVLITGIYATEGKKRLPFAGLGLLALMTAFFFDSGIGNTRVQGDFMADKENVKILQSYNGPDNTVSAVEFSDYNERAIIIDGFVTTTENQSNKTIYNAQYMVWMGHLPMLLHPDPKNALVICFGTGQTADALRQENPERLDIVDINKNVFKLAPYFTSNHKILEDPRVNQIIMDGRAHIRRSKLSYDVITLEPMPPTFAGMNALYSKEFYEISRQNMTDEGIIAQWLPFHLLSPYLSASIAKTFQSVFPNSVLWIDPDSSTGILLGSKNDHRILGEQYPGLGRNQIQRSLDNDKIMQALYYNSDELKKYGAFGDVVTDNNQLLSHGYIFQKNATYTLEENYDLLRSLKQN